MLQETVVPAGIELGRRGHWAAPCPSGLRPPAPAGRLVRRVDAAPWPVAPLPEPGFEFQEIVFSDGLILSEVTEL